MELQRANALFSITEILLASKMYNYEDDLAQVVVSFGISILSLTSCLNLL